MSAEYLNLLIEGVVVAVHYPDDESNRSGFQVEYDVDPTSVPYMGRIRNAPRASSVAGYEDANEDILRAASAALVPGTPFNANGGIGTPPTPRLDTDGDRVLVAFVNGNPHRPVIVGVLTHRLAKRKPLPKGGALVRRQTHRGTEVLYDAKGNIVVTFGDHPSPQSGVRDGKKAEIHIGDFAIRLDNTEAKTVLDIGTKSGRSLFRVTKDSIDLGEEGVAMVLGDQLVDFLTAFVKSYESHQHLVVDKALDTVASEDPGKAVDVEDLKQKLADGTLLSEWNRLSKAKP